MNHIAFVSAAIYATVIVSGCGTKCFDDSVPIYSGAPNFGSVEVFLDGMHNYQGMESVRLKGFIDDASSDHEVSITIYDKQSDSNFVPIGAYRGPEVLGRHQYIWYFSAGEIRCNLIKDRDRYIYHLWTQKEEIDMLPPEDQPEP